MVVSTERDRSVIATTNLTKRYGKSRGIAGVNLRVDEGEIFGFIGPNGAGKTTTIRLLLNFIFPSSGEARVLGLDCVRDSKKIKRRIGYLPGEVNYYSDMRVKELLDYSAGFYGKDCGARAKELAGILDLDLDKRIESLSLGNKKKIGIAQAMLHEPELLILDEPTTGLDPLVQQRFYDLLIDENRKGVTVFFSSHVLSEVQRLCSRVAILKDGTVLRVEDVGALRSRQLKRVRVMFKDPTETFPDGIDGVVSLVVDSGTARFLYSGDVDILVKTFARVGIADLTLEEPTLEEVFMHYYEEGQK